MEENDILRRRKTPISSSFSKGLLQNDHLVTVSSIHSRTVQYTNVDNRYSPPESFVDNLPKNDILKQHDSLLYLNTPKPQSFRRTIQSQTPRRTAIYDPPSYYQKTESSINRTNNPAQDLGSNSLLSYGCCCLQCVRTTEVGILENFGRFEALLEPGLHCIPWPLVDVSGRLSLRVTQLSVVCESKTLDSVFCHIEVTLQFRIIVEKAYDAYYRLTNPSQQMESYVFDVIRSKIPKMNVDQVFESKNDVANEVKIRLTGLLFDYGYEVLHSLITDIRPAASVVQSMNEINASKRLKIAMLYQAEAEKIKRIKEAEAHCESLYLQGVGVSGQRKALVEEMKESFQTYMEEGDSQTEVINLLFMTQYMDTMVAISHGGDNNLLFEQGPGKLLELKNQLSNSSLSSA